jgi:hypothetical protein
MQGLSLQIRGFTELFDEELMLDEFDVYSQRKFLKKYINQVVFTNGDVGVVGFIPVQLKTHDDPNQSSELNKIEFKIPGKVDWV